MNISDYSQYLDKYKEVAKATIEGREASVDPVSPNVSPFNDEFNNFNRFTADTLHKADDQSSHRW